MHENVSRDRPSPSPAAETESESEHLLSKVEARHDELGASTPRIIAQAKLSVGPANDVYEREADAVAGRVVRSLRAPTGVTTDPDGPRAQRSATTGSDSEAIESAPRIGRARRSAATGSDSEAIESAPRIGRVRRSATVGVGGGTLDSDTEAEITSTLGGGHLMHADARTSMEGAFGADFGHIRIHEGSKASELNERIQAKAFTVGSDIYFRDGAPDTSSREGQHLLAHELTHTIQQGGGVQREVDKDSMSTDDAKAALAGHIGAKARQQQLISGNKHGQEMAEDIARGNDGEFGPQQGNVFERGGGDYTKGFKQTGHGKYKKGWKESGAADPESEVSPEKMSQTLMNLVALTKFDDTASVSVLELAKGGTDLKDKDMWNLIVVNSQMMTYIQPGMTINKIIPDNSVSDVLEVGQTSKWFNSSQVGGSVASDKNYGQGLTGEESIANFGLDYSGYKEGTLKSDGKTSAAGGELPQYVYEDKEAHHGPNLTAVPNVFYVNIKLPEESIKDVKVPVHGNVQSWAIAKYTEISNLLKPGNAAIATMAEEAGASEAQMASKLNDKLLILDRFIKRSAVEEGALTTLTATGEKNREDPLTNLGMTKPSSRLQTRFGTINQEYFLAGRITVPENSGLFLKDATGKDLPVAAYAPNPSFQPDGPDKNQFKWIANDDQIALISRKLQENVDRRSGEDWD
jgi:hypothetical protein